MTLDPRSGVPLHRQLAAALRARILAGEWPPGRLLPAVARLAYEYEVGKMTVQTAINALRTEGLIDVQRGVGMRVREPTRLRELAGERGSLVSVRMPTPEERDEFGLAEGVPVLVVTAPNGWPDVYPGDECAIRI